MNHSPLPAIRLLAIGLVFWSASDNVQAADAGAPASPKCEGAALAAASAPTPADPYPLMAAGWGPELGSGYLASRWAEDWRGMVAASRAPALKGLAFGDRALLTLSGEMRLRHDVVRNGQLKQGNDYTQELLRTVLGADLHIGPVVRLYGEVASGQVAGRRESATANFRNTASLQQLFIEGRRYAGATMFGAMLGRQEFSDGPRQLISLSDGPNIHRSWNGIRVYLHEPRFRVGAFDFRVTRFKGGGFDESINHAERIEGINGSLILTDEGGPNTYLEPFWIRSRNASFSVGGRTGPDARDTIGARLWGRKDGLRFDLTAARQTGRFAGRPIEAWGVFAVTSLSLSERGAKPRLTFRLDAASGGNSYGSGTVKAFNQLYASSSYLGEGQFLSLANLVMASPGISWSPTPGATLSLEYGLARRLAAADVAYAGGMRPYAGTLAVPGRDIGRMFRMAGNWALGSNVTLFYNVERFRTGEVLRLAKVPSGSYAYLGATYRY